MLCQRPNRSMLGQLPPTTRNAAPAGSDVSQERRRVGDALPTSYITFPPKGNATPIVRASACASSRGLSLGVAAETAAANDDFRKGRKIVRHALLEAPKASRKPAKRQQDRFSQRRFTAALQDHQASESKEPTPMSENVLPIRARTPKDDVWDSLTAHFGEPRTKTERAMFGRVVVELLEAGATSAETVKACEYVSANFDSPSVNAVPKWFTQAQNVQAKRSAQQLEFDRLKEMR